MKLSCSCLISILFFAACQGQEKPQPTTAATTTAQAVPSPQKPPTSIKELQDRLVDALDKKDLRLLRPLLAEKLWDGYADGGATCPDGCPVDTFFARKLNNEEERAHFYESFSRIAKGGFARNDDQKDKYLAPSYELKLSENELFIVGKNVNIRETPSTKAKVLAQKSFEQVQYLTNKEGEFMTDEIDGFNWVKIKLKNGKTGFVASKFTSLNYYQQIEVVEKGGVFLVSGFIDSFVCAM